MKANAMCLNVSIVGTLPLVKRKLVVLPNTTFYELHKLIQGSMPWSNSHLHEFDLNNGLKASYPGFIDEEYEDGILYSTLDIRVQEYFRQVGDVVIYTYDFGDSWEHEIEFKGNLRIMDHYSYPYVASGKNAAPPEDCGGIFGFESLKTKIKQLKTQDGKDALDWANSCTNTVSPYNPRMFDVFTHTKPMFLFDHERIK